MRYFVARIILTDVVEGLLVFVRVLADITDDLVFVRVLADITDVFVSVRVLADITDLLIFVRVSADITDVLIFVRVIACRHHGCCYLCESDSRHH